MGRREDKKAETRRRLINAALDVFAEHGYAGASLDDVSETAGLTKGAVYSNFASKADLALAVLDRRIDAPLAIFEQVDPSVSTSEQLRVGGEMLAREIDQAATWFSLELECTVAARQNPELLEKLRWRDRVMRDALRARLAEHARATGHHGEVSDSLASALIAVVNGVALERLKDPEAFPPSLLVELISNIRQIGRNDKEVAVR